MQDRPRLDELIASVAAFLGDEIVPATRDPRLRFRARVAANVLVIALRELERGEELTRREYERLQALAPEAEVEKDRSRITARVAALTAKLAEEIREGQRQVEPGDAVWRHVRASVEEKLEIANPGHLKRTRGADSGG